MGEEKKTSRQQPERLQQGQQQEGATTMKLMTVSITVTLDRKLVKHATVVSLS
jgi:hypothetical protein